MRSWLGAPKSRSTPCQRKLHSAIAVIGIDIGKNSFHVVGHDQCCAIVLRQKWSRGQVETRLANLSPCLIGMEACVGAHHLSRKLQILGHDARLMPAKYVRPYNKGQKNDFRDAEAIAEAVQRPTMTFVATKTAEQLDLQALHRVRERLVSQRTGIINQIRAFLLERGIAVRQGLRFLRAELPGILATRSDVLSPRMLRLVGDLAGDWRRLDARIEDLSDEIEALAQQDQACVRLMTVPGIGSQLALVPSAPFCRGGVAAHSAERVSAGERLPPRIGAEWEKGYGPPHHRCDELLGAGTQDFHQHALRASRRIVWPSGAGRRGAPDRSRWVRNHTTRP
jgi:transposase